jgi:hypothetical protein
MAGHPARNLSVRCVVSQSGRATCENLQRGSPTAITSATPVTARSPSQRSKSMRGRHDNRSFEVPATKCKYRHEYQVGKSPTKIKQCARPGCGNVFPDRRGGPLYCADCRALVRKRIKQAWQLSNRERINPIRAVQQRARRAAWSTEKHERVKAQMLARYYARKPPPKKTQCECGEIFLKTGNQKYCGGDCPAKLERVRKTKKASFNKWYRQRNPLTLKPCEICEKAFHDKNGRGRVCPDCREDFRADQNRKRCKQRYHAKKLSYHLTRASAH